MKKQDTITIQATGKKWKVLKRLGGWLLLIGIGLHSYWLHQDGASTITTVLPMVVGGAMYVWGSVGKWYHHE